MVVECAAVLVILLALGVAVLQRSGRTAGILMVPLYFMPAAYLVTEAVVRYLPDGGPAPLRLVVYLLALLISGMLIGVLGRALRRRARQAYCLLAGGFNLVLAVIFTLNLPV